MAHPAFNQPCSNNPRISRHSSLYIFKNRAPGPQKLPSHGPSHSPNRMNDSMRDKSFGSRWVSSPQSLLAAKVSVPKMGWYHTERDVVEAPCLRCFEKVALKKHLWSLYHQAFIVLIVCVICFQLFDLGHEDQPKNSVSFYIFLY